MTKITKVKPSITSYEFTSAMSKRINNRLRNVQVCFAFLSNDNVKVSLETAAGHNVGGFNHIVISKDVYNSLREDTTYDSMLFNNRAFDFFNL